MRNRFFELRHITRTSVVAVLLGVLPACKSARRREANGRPVEVRPWRMGGRCFKSIAIAVSPGGGEAGLGPALNNKPLLAFLRKTPMRAGLDAMPGFDEEHIRAEELEALMACVLARRHAG